MLPRHATPARSATGVFHVKLDPASMVEGSKRATLDRYAALLRLHAVRLGLLGPRDVERIWPRHIEDSLRGVPCMGPEARTIADIGSGSGLPGVPMAISL